MSTVRQSVFVDCFHVAKELEGAGRFRESVAVLTALSQYLDVMPSFPDHSDKSIVDRYLALVSAKLKVDHVV